MITKRIVPSLLFLVMAATSTLALAQSGAADSNERPVSAFPYTPVGNPNIE